MKFEVLTFNLYPLSLYPFPFELFIGLLAREEWSQNKAFCEYCQVATVCSFASLVLAVPEVVTAVRTLLGHRSKDTEARGTGGNVS